MRQIPSCLEDILNCKAEYIFMSRQPLLENSLSKIIAIQVSKYNDNCPGPLPEGMKNGIVKFPITILGKDIFESQIRVAYELMIIFEEGRGPFDFRGTPINQFSYFAKRY